MLCAVRAILALLFAVSCITASEVYAPPISGFGVGFTSTSTSYAIGANDRGSVIATTGSGGVTHTLPTVASLAPSYPVSFVNQSSGLVTITCNAADHFVLNQHITGTTSLVLLSGQSVLLQSNGVTAWEVVSLPESPAGMAYPKTGFWTDVTSGVNVWKPRDRLFVGDGAASSGQWTATGSESWLKTALAYYFERDSQVFGLSTVGGIGATFGTRTSDYNAGNPTVAIGIAGLAVNDGTSSTNTSWGSYFESDLWNNGATVAYGIEIDTKNLAGNVTPTPYSAHGWGTVGIWEAGGGDNSYGGSSANPSSAAIIIGANSNTWNKGIIFNATGLTGTTGTGTGTAIAIDMAAGHVINWENPSEGTSASIFSKSTTVNDNMGIQFEDNGIRHTGHGGLSAFLITHVASSVNYLNTVDSVTTAPPILAAIGSDTNINLEMEPKGSGVLLVLGAVDVNTSGTGLQVKEGSNCKQGTVTLVGGSAVVLNSSVTATSRIFLTSQVDGGSPGYLRVSTRSAGVSFTVTSSSGTDTSTIAYEIFEGG